MYVTLYFVLFTKKDNIGTNVQLISKFYSMHK